MNNNFPEYTINDAAITFGFGGGTITWSSPEIGFGEITFWLDGDAMRFDTETLGREIIDKCVKFILDKSVIA